MLPTSEDRCLAQSPPQAVCQRGVVITAVGGVLSKVLYNSPPLIFPFLVLLPPSGCVELFRVKGNQLFRKRAQFSRTNRETISHQF